MPLRTYVGGKSFALAFDRLRLHEAISVLITATKLYVDSDHAVLLQADRVSLVAMEILRRRYGAEDRHPEYVFHYRGGKVSSPRLGAVPALR